MERETVRGIDVVYVPGPCGMDGRFVYGNLNVTLTRRNAYWAKKAVREFLAHMGWSR